MPATSLTLDQIWNWLEEVIDPEIPVISVVDLGIVRELNWCEDQGEPKLIVTITPTYSGCPATAVIKEDIVTALRDRGITNVQIETQLAPAWTTDWLSEQGKRRLRDYGIAPPQRFHRQPVSGSSHSCSSESYAESEASIECPRCCSKNARMVSPFCSTPCQARYVCDGLLEPFDSFKCH